MQNNYSELVFTMVNGEDYVADILISGLAEIGFDTFENTDQGFRAYIPSQNLDEKILEDVLSAYKDQFVFSYVINTIPYQNWNEVWESNFEPVIIGSQVYIRANFHEQKKEYPYQILMHPKMAFGTGHHETTFQMAEKMLSMDMKNKKVLDMGCGTGILAILAFQMGASELLAIDNDPIAAESCEENFLLNHVENAIATCGDAHSIKGKSFDVILANINRNILLRDMSYYNDSLLSGGFILFSGFYTEDLDAIKKEAEKNKLTYMDHHSKNNWIVAQFQKI
jgi:ribosomal protein L11 methyltransferase